MAYDTTKTQSQFPLGAVDLSRFEGLICSLRVNELQTILGTFKQSKLGKKQDLIQRCVQFLRSRDHQSDVVSILSDMSRRNTNHRAMPYSVPAGHQQRVYNGSMGLNAFNGGAGLGGYGGANMMHSLNHMQQQHSQQQHTMREVRSVRPMPLPFYDVIDTLMTPHELQTIPTNAKSTVKQSFLFAVPRDKLSMLTYRSELKALPRYEIQLRFFFLNGDWQSQELTDDFPLNCIVKVDDTNVTLPAVIPTNKPNAEPKRPSRPVNLTPFMQPPRSSEKPHRVTIDWTADRRQYAVAIYLVYRITADILKQRAIDQRSNRQTFEQTKLVIMRRLGVGDDDGIAMEQLRISLLCPLGKVRMSLPVRGKDCTHLQCFDLDLFLRMNEKKPTWKCAVCSGFTPYSRLIVDEYFQRMLCDVDKNTTEVELLKDGGYQTIKYEEETISSDEDCGVAKPVAPVNKASVSSAASSSTAAQQNAHSKKAVIDDDIIVLSDSDDEDIQRGIKASLARSSTSGATSNASSVKSTSAPVAIPRAAKTDANKSPPSDKSDSVIIIDLDTPPRPTVQATSQSNTLPPSVNNTNGRSSTDVPSSTSLQSNINNLMTSSAYAPQFNNYRSTSSTNMMPITSRPSSLMNMNQLTSLSPSSGDCALLQQYYQSQQHQWQQMRQAVAAHSRNNVSCASSTASGSAADASSMMAPNTSTSSYPNQLVGRNMYQPYAQFAHMGQMGRNPAAPQQQSQRPTPPTATSSASTSTGLNLAQYSGLTFASSPYEYEQSQWMSGGAFDYYQR